MSFRETPSLCTKFATPAKGLSLKPALMPLNPECHDLRHPPSHRQARERHVPRTQHLTEDQRSQTLEPAPPVQRTQGNETQAIFDMSNERKWIQYSYDDPDNAAILQVADSREEAEEDDELIMENCPWYSYKVDSSKLYDPKGPYFLTFLLNAVNESDS